MALSRAFAEKLSAPRKFRKVQATGLILGGLIFLMQNHATQMEAFRFAAPVRIAIIDATAPVSQPAFDPDADLSPRQMMVRWDPLIADAARRFAIPQAWIRNVMRSESAGRTFLNGQAITSRTGAVGLMQVEPKTYAQMAAQYRLGDDPFNPQDNIYAGAAYLRWLHGKYGFPAMFAAYNDGPGHLEDHLHGAPLPAETRAYVAGITRALGQGAEWLAGHSRVMVTAPNGRKIALDPGKVRSVRAALPGEYASSVATVIDLGRTRQGVQESPEAVLALVGTPHHGG